MNFGLSIIPDIVEKYYGLKKGKSVHGTFTS
jgi:hypothetical protein